MSAEPAKKWRLKQYHSEDDDTIDTIVLQKCTIENGKQKMDLYCWYSNFDTDESAYAAYNEAIAANPNAYHTVDEE